MDLRTLAADAIHDVRALDATRPVTLTGPGGGRPSTAPAVADEGPGLTPEERERVFDRFYRTDDSRARTTGGSGLGLATARALVTAHGGRVVLDTAPEQGCAFRTCCP